MFCTSLEDRKSKLGIGTWTKVEREKLSKLSASDINDNCPGLAFVL